MSRGRRYEEKKLNLKKVFATILAIVVIIMFIFVIKGILNKDEEQGKIISKDYFVSFKNNKWGVIDSSGNDVIAPSYAEIIIIPNSKRDVFLCTYDVNYETNEFKTKALNSKNEEIFTQYAEVSAIQNYDENNNLWYEEDVIRVKNNGKYGIIDFLGKELLPCEYDEITVVTGIKNALKVKKDGQYGIVDNEGKKILKEQYKDIKNLGKDNKAGFIVQSEDSKWGVVDYSANVILETKYDEIDKNHTTDLYIVKQDGKQKLVKKQGEEVLTAEGYEIKNILNNSENGIIYVKDGKYGVMKITGETVIEPSYQDLKESKSGILIAKQDEKYGIIDLQKNNKVDFKYMSIYYNESADLYITENEVYNNDIIDSTYAVRLSGILTNLDNEKGYMELRQGEQYKYYNFKFEEKNQTDIFTSNTLFLSKNGGKYGFVDKDGNVVVDYVYDDATNQNLHGFAGVKKDGKWGSVNSKGEVVQEPTYNLDEYLKIDFIGRWHYGKDINMNYYNQL